MNIKKMTAVIMAALVIASFSGCGTPKNSSSDSGTPVTLLDTSDMFSSRDIESGYEESECTIIKLNGTSASIDGEGATAKKGTVKVDSEGTYLISGTLDDGIIVVDADSSDKIRLILNGVTIRSSTGAAIYVKQADKVFITLAKGTENTLSNTTDSEMADNVDAVVFSKDDLTVNGEGSLTVTANSGHAIVCKDDLVISGGKYSITSEKKALDANDSIRIAGGTFNIDAGTDALHAENDDASLGYIYIADGIFHITSGTDGLDASGVIQIDNGTLHIKTGGGSANASTKKDGGFNGDWGSWGGRGKHMSLGEDDAKTITKLSASSDQSEASNAPKSGAASTDSSSAKGLKSDSSVAVNNGTVTIDSSDDAIHSDNQVTIANGNVQITSGDDGIHADSALKISGGTVNIAKSYEGLEGMTIDISGGNVSVTASDDGLNAAGGNDQSSMNGRPGQNKFAAQEGVCISVSGGVVNVNSVGDGIDSNGDVKISGGEVYVSGAADNGNAALDFNGEATITGGVFIAAGMSGMAQNFGSASTQGAMMINVESQSGGSTITLKNSSGKTLATFTPEKNYNNVVISTPDVEKGSTYTVSTGSVNTNVTMDSLIYGSGGGMGGMGGGRMGGDFPDGNMPGGNMPGGQNGGHRGGPRG